MRYQAVWTVASRDQSTPDAVVSDLRVYASGANDAGSAVAAECRLHRVKRRVAKRWSGRVIRTCLPRSRRLAGPMP